MQSHFEPLSSYAPLTSRQGFRPSGVGLPPLPAPVTAGVTPYSAAEQDPLYSADSDASYAFSFTADGYERQESSDESGNVRGQYSYVDQDGVLRTLSYTAGSGLGFVPVANYIPSDENVE